jgi:hypothetical protein
VRVYYHPGEISEVEVRASLFTPTKLKVRDAVSDGIDSLAIHEIGVLHLFDLIDVNNLTIALRQEPGVYGFETRYGEPVLVTLFYDAAAITPARIRKLIESEEVTAKTTAGEETLELEFECEDGGRGTGAIAAADYARRIFRPYDRFFNGYDDYDPAHLEAWVFPMPEADAAPLRRYLPSLASHLSADDGVVRLSTRYLDGPVGIVFFDPAQTTAEKVRQALARPVLTVFRTQAETQEMENPFHLTAEGRVVKAENLAIEGE